MGRLSLQSASHREDKSNFSTTESSSTTDFTDDTLCFTVSTVIALFAPRLISNYASLCAVYFCCVIYYMNTRMQWIGSRMSIEQNRLTDLTTHQVIMCSREDAKIFSRLLSVLHLHTFSDHVLREVAGEDKMAFWARCHTITPAKFPQRNTLVPLQMTLQFSVCVQLKASVM